MLEPGDAAPSFTLRDQNRAEKSLEDFRSSPVVLVFMPFPFTTVCGGEMCELRDNLGRLNDLSAQAVVVTCDTLASNRAWADAEGFEFPILSDFWPHGEVTRRYGCFNEAIGVANRATFVIDGAGVVRDVIATDRLSNARPFSAYVDALAAL